MEYRFGESFGDVRVHTDQAAATSAQALDANAYTSGRDIYFAQGKYAPDTDEGQHLLAHELTHTLQQGEGQAPVATSRIGGVIVGDVSDPLEREAEQVADRVTEAPASPLEISRDNVRPVRRDLKEGAAALWNATGGQVVSTVGSVGSDIRAGAGAVWNATGAKVVTAAGEAWDEAKETVVAFIDRLAPGVLPLLRNAGKLLFEKITAGADGLFNGIASRVQKQGVVGAITSLLTEIAGSIGKTLGGLVSGACSALGDAASAIVSFVKGIAGEAFAELGKIAKSVGDFFSDLWKDFGEPALDAIKKVAGDAWKWITEKATWVWDQLLPIRKAAGAAWDWIKKQFNIAKDEANGLLDRFYDWAKEQWMEIREKIEPILGPLKIVGGVLLLLSPMGPIIAIWKGGPYLWKALEWIWTNGIKPQVEEVRSQFREHILPQILAGIDAITAKLDEASQFLCDNAGKISSGLQSLEDALTKLPFMGIAARVVGVARGFFDNLAAKGKCKFSDVIAEVKAVLLRVYQFVKPILELLRQAALIAMFGPWAILDDGVWKTLNDILAFAKKTPCIKELAGLIRIDSIMAKVGEIRLVLKDIWEVMSNQEKFEAAIHEALDGMLEQIPSQVKSVLGTIAGLDGPHLDTLLTRFVNPKLAEVVSKAPQLLIDMAWSLVWPIPGVIKEYEEIEKQVDKLKTALWDFQFSRAIDAGLAIWRGVNGIVGLLYGWFFLAAVIIGAVFASPQAGAAVAYEVGEVLLVSTLIAEVLSIEKAKSNLMSSARLAKPEEERELEDKEDYETISGSVINLAIIGALAVLGEIAVDFAKAVFAEIKGIFLPEAAKGPKVEVPTGAPRPGEPVTPRPGEPVTPRPGEPVTPPEPRPVEPPRAAEPKPGEPTQPRPGEPPKAAEPKPGEPAEPKPGEPAEPKPGEPAEPKPGEPAEPKPGEPAEPKPGEPAEPKPGEPAEPKPGEPAEPKPGEPAEPKLEEPAESPGETPTEEPEPQSKPGEKDVDPAICFPAGTLVSTKDGLTPIENVAPGTDVFAYDFVSRELVTQKVLSVTHGSTSHWVDIHIGQDVLRATPTHPIWVESAHEWIRAEDLQPGMTVLAQSGEILEVEKIDLLQQDEKQATYNLSINAVENFFVGSLRLLVHNITKTRLKYLSRKGFSVYYLRSGGPKGKIYYVGIFGPGSTPADVQRRHAKNHNRFDPNSDFFDLQKGSYEYGEARLKEQRDAVKNKTINKNAGEDYRFNRQDPLAADKRPEYLEYEQFKQGCG
jgi:hypothetical protein